VGIIADPRPVDDARAERMAQLRESLEDHRRRHAADRAFPALHAFAEAEAAVRAGRAEWLPMSTD
jgi:hypothetical protein